MVKGPKDRLEKRREYYQRNKTEEKQRSREHMAHRREAETISETLIRKAKHCEAAARYRTAHRTQLRINEWQRRQCLKRKKELEEDEAEFQALMAAEDSDDE